MKFISFNVNGLRACVNKGFIGFFEQIDADIFALQETKLQPGQLQLEFPGYNQYWNYAEKKGYSGTAVFSRLMPLSVQYDIGIPEFSNEGSVITLEFDTFYFVTVYTPNSQRELNRLLYRMSWDNAFRDYVGFLKDKKPVVICGDLNVAHREIDLKNPDTNRRNAGFTDEERGKLSDLLGSGFIDTFRHLYPDRTGAYSWWSYMFNARANNAGWRIDYFLVSEDLEDRITEAFIMSNVEGSDHCPVGLEIAL